MEIDEYRRLYEGRDDAAPGWDSIDAELKPIYAAQEPRHWGSVVKHMLGGPDPLDGISAYECTESGIDHLHFITYGYTSLYYDEEAVGGEFSRYGFEMTFRLASELPPDEDPIWVCGLLQNLARYVFESGKWFEAHQWIPANGPIRRNYDTAIVGLAFLRDPRLDAVNSPHGRIEFIQAFGLTQSELDSLSTKTDTVAAIIARHRSDNPLLVTSLERLDV